MIEKADLVPRAEACRGLQFAKVSRSASQDLIDYVAAADAQHEAFCNPKGH